MRLDGCRVAMHVNTWLPCCSSSSQIACFVITSPRFSFYIVNRDMSACLSIAFWQLQDRQAYLGSTTSQSGNGFNVCEAATASAECCLWKDWQTVHRLWPPSDQQCAFSSCCYLIKPRLPIASLRSRTTGLAYRKSLQTAPWWRFHLDAQSLKSDRPAWAEQPRLRDRKKTKQADKSLPVRTT